MKKYNLLISIIWSAAVVILLALVIFQDVAIEEMEQYNDESQRFIEYWRQKTDSLSYENAKLYIQINELKDSIMFMTEPCKDF